MHSSRGSRQVFIGVAALLFAATTAGTILWCRSMSSMGEMPMPGGWMLSMAWIRMPGQTWTGTAASFLCMWILMMVAMMLPSLMPMLWRYRQVAVSTGEARLVLLTVLVGIGYFFVWTILGMAIFFLGNALTTLVIQHPALARMAPAAGAVVVLTAAAFQFTAWKTRYLACCRETPCRARTLPTRAATAWRLGLYLGLHCSYCCANLMVILLVIGIMNLGAMAIVTAAIAIERLVPAGQKASRVIGILAIGAGLFLTAQAAGLV